MVETYPDVLSAILAQAAPARLTAAAATAAADDAQGAAQGQPAAPLGLDLAPEGSSEQKHALGCLHSLLSGLKQDFWQLSAACVSPQQLMQDLQDSCWAAVRQQDSMLLKALLQVLQALAQVLIPCLSASDTAELWQESEEEAEGDEGLAAAAAAVRLDAAECKGAVLVCLRLLLVQLPGSASVPLLMRGAALEVRTDRVGQQRMK